MRNAQKTKSRSKLYNAINGVKEISGAAGTLGTWTVSFPNLAAAGDTVTVGTTVFEFVADGSEDTPGDSAGTVADPHLITIGGTPTATTAAAALVAALLAETTTTGAWGYLYPDDSVGASNSSGVVTIKFWPGTFPNAAGYIAVTATGTDPTVTKTVSGVAAPVVETGYGYNFIDTTGSAADKEYYEVEDGSSIGDKISVMVTTFATDDTPTLVGKLSDQGVANVEALFTTAEPGMSASFIWTGSAWELEREGNGTALTFTAAS